MEKLNIDIVDKEKINKIREYAIYKIYSDKECIDFINENNISEEVVKRNASKFLKMIEERNICKNCTDLSSCKKQNKGSVITLTYDKDEEILNLKMTACKLCSNFLKMSKNYIYRDFPDYYLNIKINELANADYAVSRKNVFNTLREIYRDSEKKGIYLYGGRQVGKSLILAVFSRMMIEKSNSTCAYIDTPTFVKNTNDLNFTNKDEFNRRIKEIMNVDLLFFDDFGNEYKNIFIRDTIIYPILNERLKNGKFTFFSSNYSLDEIERMYELSERFSPKSKQLVELIKMLSKPICLNSIPYIK